jgi:hypothetical protein
VSRGDGRQGLVHLSRCLEAVRGVLLHRLEHNRLDRGRNARVDLARGLESPGVNPARGGVGGYAVRQQVVEGCPQGVDVRTRICLAAAVLLKGRVSPRTQRGRISGRRRFEDARDAKVDQLDLPVPGEHHVGGLHVPENDRLRPRMQVVQDIAQLQPPIQDKPLIDWATNTLLLLFQGLPLDILHEEVSLAALLKEIANIGQVGMTQLYKQVGLVAKIRDGLGALAGGEVSVAHLLDGDDTPRLEALIARFIDGTKAALTD